MTEESALKVGSFYWVVPVFDPDTDNTWELAIQPARFAGDGEWNCLGVEGENNWPMRWVGDEIVSSEP